MTVFGLEKQVEAQENLLKEGIETLEKKLDTENYCTDMYCKKLEPDTEKDDNMEPFYQPYAFTSHQVR